MMSSRLMEILRAPVISEKGNAVAETNNTIAFKVMPDATKGEIKSAVEKIFNVQVLSVHTVNMQGKKRRSVHGIGSRSDWKKAYVKVAAGQNIDFNAALAEKGE